MENVTTVQAPERISIPVTAWLAAALAFVALYAGLNESGAILSHVGPVLHEFFHDGRHLLGVPCH